MRRRGRLMQHHPGDRRGALPRMGTGARAEPSAPLPRRRALRPPGAPRMRTSAAVHVLLAAHRVQLGASPSRRLPLLRGRDHGCAAVGWLRRWRHDDHAPRLWLRRLRLPQVDEHVTIGDTVGRVRRAGSADLGAERHDGRGAHACLPHEQHDAHRQRHELGRRAEHLAQRPRF